jgi:hypothetical protein
MTHPPQSALLVSPSARRCQCCAGTKQTATPSTVTACHQSKATTVAPRGISPRTERHREDRVRVGAMERLQAARVEVIVVAMRERHDVDASERFGRERRGRSARHARSRTDAPERGIDDDLEPVDL